MLTYKIAGLSVAMETFGRTLVQSEAYRSPEKDCQILIPVAEHIPEPSALTPEQDVEEYMRTCSCYYTRLIEFEGMMLHASCVVADGHAFLFSAPCGTGKSTHTALWLRQFGESAYILNDDKPALRWENGRFFVYGTPWSGKTDQNRNERVPLGGIGVLRRADSNSTKLMEKEAAVFSLMDQTLRPLYPERVAMLMKTLDRLLSLNCVHEVFVNTDPEAALVTRKAMEERIP